MRRNNVWGLAAVLVLSSAAHAKEAKKDKPTWFQTIGNVVPDSKDSADVAGVRGLEDDGDVKIVGSEARDYAAMEELESVSITDEELKQFIAEGQLR